MESGEVIFEKEQKSPRPPPTFPFQVNWMKEFDSEVAGGSEDTQRIFFLSFLLFFVFPSFFLSFLLFFCPSFFFFVLPCESNQNLIIKNGETRGWTRIHQGDRERFLVWSRGHQAPTRTERPVGGQESTKVEDLDIDFRVPGLSHAVEKKAEHFSEFERSSKRSKFIFIEKQFKPICSRQTCTTHLATI